MLGKKHEKRNEKWGRKMSIEKQLKKLMNKQKKLISQADTEEERAELIGFAVGFLNGMRMSKVITNEQYVEEYAKLQSFVEIRKVG